MIHVCDQNTTIESKVKKASVKKHQIPFFFRVPLTTRAASPRKHPSMRASAEQKKKKKNRKDQHLFFEQNFGSGNNEDQIKIFGLFWIFRLKIAAEDVKSSPSSNGHTVLPAVSIQFLKFMSRS